MVDFNSALIKKIVRMLESEHDGERAAAAGKLNSMAKGAGKNIDELLAVVYGGKAQQEAPKAARGPKPGRSSWGDEWGGADFQDPPPWTSASRREEFVRRKYAEREARERAEAEADAKRRARSTFGDARDDLKQHFDMWGDCMLTPWEQDFVSDIFDWRSALTAPQKAIVARILEKYAAYAQRNGEAESFWKA